MAAWDAFHAAFAGLPGWRASHPQRNPLTGEWTVVVFDGGKMARGRVHDSLEATGWTEAEAVARLEALAVQRRGADRG